MQKSPEPVWSRDFALHCATNYLMSLGYYLLAPLIPLFAVQRLGISLSQAGYVISVYTLAAVAIRPLAGFLIDAYGRKSIFLWALGCFSLLALGYKLTATLPFLILLRLFHGLSWGIISTGGGTIASDLLPSSRRGEGLGYYGIAMNLGMATGPILGVWILGSSRWSWLFMAAAAVSAGALLAGAAVKENATPLTWPRLSWSAFVEKKALPMCLVIFFATLVYGGLISFIALFSQDNGITGGGWLFFLFFSLSVSLLRPVSGKAFDRRGPVPVGVTGFLSLSSGLILLAGSHAVSAFAAAAILIGTGYGCILPSMHSMIVSAVAPERRGIANSAYYSFMDLGIGTGSFLSGWLAGVTSIQFVYRLSGLVMLVPLAYLILIVSPIYRRRATCRLPGS